MSAKLHKKDPAKEAVLDYIDKVKQALRLYGPRLVFNSDETPVYLGVSQAHTTQRIGLPTPAVNCFSNDKVNYTALATIDASGNHYPLTFIARGKTRRAELNLKIGRTCFLEHSPSGKTNVEIIGRHIEMINRFVFGNPCALLLDAYRAHTCQAINDAAHQLNVEIIPIPENSTAKRQPLDHSIFGPLKAEHKAFLEEQWGFERTISEQRSLSLSKFADLWERVPRESIVQSFELVLQDPPE